MNTPCDALCPFIGCDSCDYAGGTEPDKEDET